MDNDISSEGLLQSSDDDSDADLVTDYLDAPTLNNNISNNNTTTARSAAKLYTPTHTPTNIKNYFVSTIDIKDKGSLMSSSDLGYTNGSSSNNFNNAGNNTITITTPSAQTNNYNNNNNNNNIIINNHHNCNMVPIISVTPHSPGTKYNSILEDSLNHLQSIRESVVQMKNSSAQNTNFGNIGIINPTLASSKVFYSCPSLPNLSATNATYNAIWLAAQNALTYTLNDNRRKSWTAIEDLTDCTKNSHKSSVSLTSLDSEEQESLRTNERLHNRTNRNSTGGISTHSLNEAELARDFEKLNAKRNLAPAVCRIPLQKSVSTPSIAPVQNVKEENAVPEVFVGPEKRRKRGSLFSRKKKDKMKTKGQSTNCDACGAAINLALYKEHAVECKMKLAKSQNLKSSSGKKNSTSSHNSHHDSRDYYDGHSNDHANYSDDTPLIRDEFLNEAQIGPHDLGAESILGVAIDEPDSWSPSVPKEVVKSLKDKLVKRQEHIYEFIMTEKHHCQTLLVMQKVFVDSLQRHFSHLNLERMFPRLQDLTELHILFLKKLRLKQREHHIVDSIADILLDFFSALSAQKLKSAYGEFCSNHRSALDTFKYYMTEDQTFAEWYKHCLHNPLLKKKGIPECILFVTQRLTKYPLLIQPLLKSSGEDKIEQEKLMKAMRLVREILIDVDSRVADKDKEDRQLEIFKRIDAKSHAILKLIDERSDYKEIKIKEMKFKKSDIMSSNRKLKFEGLATLMQGRSKMLTVLVVVLSDCLFFLQENSHKYTFFNPENKAGVVTLQKLLIREKASDSRGIYIISSNPANPEMYELKVQNPKDKNVWIQSIRAAVLDCPADDTRNEDTLTADQKQRHIDEKQAYIRDLILGSGLEGKMRQKDFEQAMALEEKIALHLELLLNRQGTFAPNAAEQLSPGVNTFISSFGSYRDLVVDDCDPIEIWKRTLIAVQDISQLASSLYTAATGLPLSRSFSSVGERQSDVYISPTLPKRAETFGGFDERRSNKQSYIQLARDAGLPTLSPGYFSNRDHEKRESTTSDLDSMSNMTDTEHVTTEMLKDNNYAALQVSHNLHTLLCIISQQMTTIQSLQSQLNNYRENPKNMYRHNDQLEELRNLQDRLQEEKTAWTKQKELQERELDEEKKKQKALKEQIKKEQQDIQEQREQLYRKMEILSSQGLLISPNVAIPVNQPVNVNNEDTQSISGVDEHHTDGGGIIAAINASIRKDNRWNKPMPAIKPPTANLASATNSPKIPTSVKQQLPLKLSTLSNTKPTTNTLTSPASVTQMFPLKLADKKPTAIVPNHSRTGSSPAVIQQPIPAPQYQNPPQHLQQTGNPATRTNTYPKSQAPERYRLRSSDAAPTEQTVETPQKTRSVSLHGSATAPLLTKVSPNNHLSSNNSNINNNNKTNSNGNDLKEQNKEEEVIYF
ncbi:rho guanine nucleotide exchange factor 18 isoform X4 [Chironomus tepperi]|uniref:rho guanine nucleotide exchange factor 18 isoform X4 n=1 Tax=Chironomus tepperi TaxID=113505 RepID=UPI00391F3C2F